MKVQPIIVIGQDGLTPLEPVQPGDLAPLASETTLQAVQTALGALATEATQAEVLAAIQAQSGGITKASELALDANFQAGLANWPVPFGTLATVTRLRVLALTGATLTVKLGGTGESAISLAQGDVLDGLEIAAAAGLYLNSPGAAGATLTLQLFGR